MARPDEWMNELPSLVRAAAKGNISEAAGLLRAGSDPNEADEDGWTAMHAAAAFNHLQIVELLLQAGAAVDTRSHDGFTPLLNAAQAEAPVIAALLNAGADPAAHDARLGWRPLHRFAGYANAPAVQLVLDAGAEVDARDFSGGTALMDAAEAGSTECIELLLRAGANPAVIYKGQTASSLAAKQGHHILAAYLASRTPTAAPTPPDGLDKPAKAAAELQGGLPTGHREAVVDERRD
jgi:ankyrin repeat protein